MLLRKAGTYAPTGAAGLIPVADSNMRRYSAWLAFEGGDLREAFRMLLSAFRKAPIRAIAEFRNWLVLGAVVVGALLPVSPWQVAT